MCISEFLFIQQEVFTTFSNAHQQQFKNNNRLDMVVQKFNLALIHLNTSIVTDDQELDL